MGIFDRLGTVINSYISDFADQTGRKFGSSANSRSGDPDFDAAYDELNDFLNGKETYSEKKQSGGTNYYWQSAEGGQSSSDAQSVKNPPAEILADYKFLGIAFDADDETCKAQYKKLLKIHHPDRHTGHEANYKKATEMSARINAAWDRIEKYRKISGGKK